MEDERQPRPAEQAGQAAIEGKRQQLIGTRYATAQQIGGYAIHLSRASATNKHQIARANLARLQVDNGAGRPTVYNDEPHLIEAEGRPQHAGQHIKGIARKHGEILADIATHVPVVLTFQHVAYLPVSEPLHLWILHFVSFALVM